MGFHLSFGSFQIQQFETGLDFFLMHPMPLTIESLLQQLPHGSQGHPHGANAPAILVCISSGSVCIAWFSSSSWKVFSCLHARLFFTLKVLDVSVFLRIFLSFVLGAAVFSEAAGPAGPYA